MATALLFDRDRVDEVDDWTDSLPRVGRSAILWIDLEKRDAIATVAVATLAVARVREWI